MLKRIKDLLLRLFELQGFQLLKDQYFTKTKKRKIEETKFVNSIDDEVLNNIMNFYKKVSPFYSDQIRKELQIGGAWKNNIKLNRKLQLQAIEDNDKEAYRELIENMFRNEMVSQMWDGGYYNKKLIGKEIPYDFYVWMDAFKYLTDRTEEDLVSDSIGNPWGCDSGHGIIKLMDPRQGIKAQSIINLINIIDKEKNHKPTLLDLGSGFGGDMEKVARWYNKPLRIILSDIPVNLTSAYAFISSSIPSAKSNLIETTDELAFLLQDDINGLEFIFLPNCFIEELEDIEIDIFHNHGSLSEMDRETVEFYLGVLLKNTNYFHEINSNRPAYLSDSHMEVSSKEFPIPESHQLISRTPTWYTPRGHRYLTNIYKKIDTSTTH